MLKRALDKFRYVFDNMMSRGLLPLISLLAMVTVVFIIVVSLVVATFNLFPLGESLTLGEVMWASLLRTLDPGTMANDTGIGFRAAMLLVTLFGVVLVASLIGIISNSLSSRIEQLRKGKSRVLEQNHTLILGWNAKTIQIIREISIANLGHKHSVIAVLADRDKVEMEEEIRSKLGHIGKTRLVVRSGSPMSKTDLAIVDPGSARSIIILAPEYSNDADSISIKTCLALRGLSNPPKPECGIVGEIQSQSNLEAAELVSQGAVHWVLGQDLISRLIVQTCRQGGLSAVFTDLLDFDGSEFYLLDSSSSLGKTYRDLSLSLTESVATGVLNETKVQLNPAPDYVFESGDQLVVIAENETKLAIGDKGSVKAEVINQSSGMNLQLESTLILGSNLGMDLLLMELDADSLPSSRVILVNTEVNLKDVAFRNISLEVVLADPTKRQVLEELNVNEFNHIIIVANREALREQEADARTLLTLLHVRALTNEGSNINIVSEILDDHNRELAETSRADDFIVSDKVVSHVIAQLSENKHLAPLFNALFSGEGGKISLSPASSYITTGVPVSFDTVVEAALRKEQSAIGYRLHSLKSEPGEMHGVRLNPSRGEEITYTTEDSIILIDHR